jgi:hypothetical protein
MWSERFSFWLALALVLGTLILLGIGLFLAGHWIAVLLGGVLFLVAVAVIMGMLNF